MNGKAGLFLISLILCSLPAFPQHRGNNEHDNSGIAGVLDSTLSGTSSLFYWNHELWSSNDHGQLRLFSIDTTNAHTKDSVRCGFRYQDMEEVAQDDQYFYFGDFGNNGTTLRDDLYILRIPKQLLLMGSCHCDTIHFSYCGYTTNNNRMSGGLPTTDFDCEAMVAIDDSLYLFTKQWTSQQTVCFALPKTPGRYIAMPRFKLNVNGLVTGACHFRLDRLGLKQKNVIALCGYNILAQPFVYLIYDFSGTNFTKGRREKIAYLNNVGWQTEAIATADGIHYWITSERFSRLGVNNPPRLLTLDLSSHLAQYISTLEPLDIDQPTLDPWPTLAPNPTDGIVQLIGLSHEVLKDLKVEVWDSQGRMLKDVVNGTVIDLSKQPAGVYVVRMTLPQDGVATRRVRLLPSAKPNF